MEITRITNENMSYFAEILPPDIGRYEGEIILLGILDDIKSVAGAMSVRLYNGFADIISLYILPVYRRQGYGTTLINWIEDILKGAEYDAIVGEFSYGTPSACFCNSLGFDIFEGRPRHFFSLKEFMRSPLYKRLVEGKKPKKIKPVSEITKLNRKLLESKMNFKDYDPKWSTVHLRMGRVLSCLFAKREGSEINISLLFSRSDDPVEFLQHIRALANKAIEEFPDHEVVFRMNFERDKVINNFYRLLGGKEHLHKEGQFFRAVKLIGE